MPPAPRIVGFSPAFSRRPYSGEKAVLAHLTIDFGPVLIVGWNLVQNAMGEIYIRPPLIAAHFGRVHLKHTPERTALVRDAIDRWEVAIGLPRAAPPLATAPENPESSE